MRSPHFREAPGECEEGRLRILCLPGIQFCAMENPVEETTTVLVLSASERILGQVPVEGVARVHSVSKVFVDLVKSAAHPNVLGALPGE